MVARFRLFSLRVGHALPFFALNELFCVKTESLGARGVPLREVYSLPEVFLPFIKQVFYRYILDIELIYHHKHCHNMDKLQNSSSTAQQCEFLFPIF